MRKAHRILGHAGPQRAAGAAHKKNGAQGRLAIFLDARHRLAQRSGQIFADGPQFLVEFEIGVMLARRAHHQQTKSRPRHLRLEGFEDRQRVFDVGAAPRRSRLRNLKIPAWGRTPPFDLDSCLRHAQQFSCLVLGKHARDVIVDHHLIDFAIPLLGEHPDGCGATAHPHALFEHVVDHGRLSRLHDDSSAFIDLQLHSFAVA